MTGAFLMADEGRLIGNSEPVRADFDGKTVCAIAAHGGSADSVRDFDKIFGASADENSSQNVHGFTVSFSCFPKTSHL